MERSVPRQDAPHRRDSAPKAAGSVLAQRSRSPGAIEVKMLCALLLPPVTQLQERSFERLAHQIGIGFELAQSRSCGRRQRSILYRVAHNCANAIPFRETLLHGFQEDIADYSIVVATIRGTTAALDQPFVLEEP